MITTNELVDGVISNVDLLPVTALESVTPVNIENIELETLINFERMIRIYFSLLDGKHSFNINLIVDIMNYM